MARRVFFSFHFDDSWRANQVRMANVVGGAEVAGFYDHSLYEEKKRGGHAIRREILKQLDGTSVTVVLIGTRTAERPWVDFEIRESVKRDNGLVGIAIHHLSAPSWPGAPAYLWGPSPAGKWPSALPAGTPVYIWDPKKRDGFARVIEEAAQRGERLRAAKREGQRRASAIQPPPALVGATLGDILCRKQQADRIIRALAPPPRRPALDIETLLREYRIRRILGGDG
jgi:hypothetical protein